MGTQLNFTRTRVWCLLSRGKPPHENIDRTDVPDSVALLARNPLCVRHSTDHTPRRFQPESAVSDCQPFFRISSIVFDAHKITVAHRNRAVACQ